MIEEDGVLYPVEIKMSGNPKASMGATNQVLDKVSDKKEVSELFLCLIDKKDIFKRKSCSITDRIYIKRGDPMMLMCKNTPVYDIEKEKNIKL